MKNKEQILFSLFAIIDSFEKITTEYLESFDMNAALSFSDDEKLRKKHLHSYNSFSIKLKTHIERCEKEIALLSELICNADNACDHELTESLVKQFERYTVFSMSVSRFIKNCDSAFLDKENKFSPLLISNYTRELLVAIRVYKQNK